MTQTQIHESKSHQQKSYSLYEDPNIRVSPDNFKETFSSKKKIIRKQNYQRRKKRFIVHSLCILDKSDPTSHKYIIETFLLQDKKSRHQNATADVLALIQKKNDQYLQMILEKMKMKNNEQEIEKKVKKSLGSTNEQFGNQNVQNTIIWNGQVFQNTNLPYNLMNFSQKVLYPQYSQHINWMGMI